MAFPAVTTQLAYNSRNKPGGGPHTLRCNKCFQPFEDNDQINGPSRNRGSDANPNGNPPWTSPNDPAWYHKLEYWHENCSRPKGRYTTQTPSITTPSYTPTQTAIATQPNTNTNNGAAAAPDAEFIAEIVKTLQNHLLPQLETITDNLEAKLDNAVVNTATAIANLTASTQTKLDAFQAALDAAAANRPIIVSISRDNLTTQAINVGRQHRMFTELLALLASGVKNVWLTGPAGSGKSTAAEMVAKALDIAFHIQGVVSDPIELLGYMNANGGYVTTNFRKAFEHGGIILLDEIDAYDPRSGLAANAALANGMCAFPDGTIARHPSCVVIAAANTWGFGGDSDYVGRNKLDSTTLDRFETLDWEYDESFERDIATADGTNALIESYITAVQATRATVLAHRTKGYAITPRSSINGAKMLRGGLSPQAVVKARFQRYRSQSMWATLGKPIEDWLLANTPPTPI